MEALGRFWVRVTATVPDLSMTVLLAAAVDAGSAACTTYGGFGHGRQLSAPLPEAAWPGSTADPVR